MGITVHHQAFNGQLDCSFHCCHRERRCFAPSVTCVTRKRLSATFLCTEQAAGIQCPITPRRDTGVFPRALRPAGSAREIPCRSQQTRSPPGNQHPSRGVRKVHAVHARAATICNPECSLSCEDSENPARGANRLENGPRPGRSRNHSSTSSPS